MMLLKAKNDSRDSVFSGPTTSRLESESSRKQVARGTLAIFDQFLVSGSSFVTVIIIQRAAGTAELGIYSVAFSLLMTIAGLQTALIISPLTVFLPRRNVERRSLLLGSALGQHALLAPSVFCGSLAVWMILRSIASPFGSLALAFTVALAGLMSREFVRRLSFAMMNFRHAAALDGIAMTLRFAGFLSVNYFWHLSAASALVVIGIADILATALWFGVHATIFDFSRKQFVEDCRESWNFGRWGVLSQSMYLGQAHAVHWLIAVFCGTAATGVYSMCSSVVQLASPFIQGAGNAIGPILAKAYASDGRLLLRKLAGQATFVLLIASTCYLLILWFAGGQLLELLFREEGIAGQWPVVVWLSIGTASSLVSLPAAKAIGVLEKPAWRFAINAIALGVTLSAAAVAAAKGNLTGAAAGVCTGLTIAMILRWGAYWHLLQLRAREQVA